jgi:hypothetical protein
MRDPESVADRAAHLGVQMLDLLEQRLIEIDGYRHRHLLPARGTPLDIREEEGDGAGGEIGHDPLQTLGGT